LEKPKTRQQEIPIRPSDHSFFAAGEDIPRDHDILVKRVSWPEAQARADEIVAAYRARDAECEAVERSVGFDRSDDVSDEIHDKINALEDGIIDIPAKTLPGLRVKAMAVAWCYLGVEKFLSEDPGGQAIGDQIAFSMVPRSGRWSALRRLSTTRQPSIRNQKRAGTLGNELIGGSYA
jgi:hypothetical protein